MSNLKPPIEVSQGGTGATTASGARTNLGLAIGTNVEAWDADLDAIAALSGTGLVVRTGTETWTNRQITSTDSSITITNPDGVSGNVNLSGKLVQQIRSVKSGNQSIGTTLPYDNTVPQNTEGDEVLTVSITPKSASNILVVEATCFGEANVARACMAIFETTTANALFATACSCNATPNLMVIRGFFSAGSTSARTYSLRAGPGSAGTFNVNGVSGGTGIFGGSTVPNTTLVISEYTS